MKTTTLLLALILGAVSQATSVAQVPDQITIIPAGMPKGGVLTQADVIKVLTSNVWTWETTSSPGKGWTIKFMPDGSGWAAGGPIHYDIVGMTKITVRRKEGKSGSITFKKDFTSFDGIDVKGNGLVQGVLVIPQPKISSGTAVR